MHPENSIPSCLLPVDVLSPADYSYVAYVVVFFQSGNDPPFLIVSALTGTGIYVGIIITTWIYDEIRHLLDHATVSVGSFLRRSSGLGR